MDIVPHKQNPDEDVIAAVEDLLEDAKSGRLQGIAAAGVNEKREVITVFAGLSLPFQQVGALQAVCTSILIRDSAQVAKSLRETLEL